MKKLDGCDDRAMVLDGDHLEVLRWGNVENRFIVTELPRGEVYRDDKGKLLGVFGGKEERCRVTFGGVATTIWVPLAEQAQAEDFLADVNAAIESGGSA